MRIAIALFILTLMSAHFAAAQEDDKHAMRLVVGDKGQILFTVGGRPVMICAPGVKTARLTDFRCYVDRKAGEKCPDGSTIFGVQCGPVE